MMRFAGKVFKVGRHWAVEVPILHVVSQGRSKREALEMIADAIESLVNKPDFRIGVFPGKGEYFEIGSSDQATLMALLLRRERLMSGLSLGQVAARLGAKSLNAYARYERGGVTPTIGKLSQLYAAVAKDRDLVLTENHAP